jgi:sulfatase modifying factor 1
MSLGNAPDLARIPAGDFLMGAAFDSEKDERPVHRVYVSEFFIGRFEVTNDEYARFVRATGHASPGIRQLPIAAQSREAEFVSLAGRYVWVNDEPPSGRGAHPVVLVSYADATAYCRWLSETADRLYRMPSEAEWEKAARGGEEGQRYPWGDEIDQSCGNFLIDASLKSQKGTRPTGTYPPNGYGLCDVSGNVWEWVSDWYGADYYEGSEPRDPRGPGRGAMRVVRGGSWVNDDVRSLRCSCRHPVPPDTYAHSIGFRVVCTD